MFGIGSITSTLLTCLTVATLFAFAPLTARADRLDDAILQQVPEVIKKCKDKGYKNVGVLKFLYQRVQSAARYHGVAICSNMPQRVENAIALKLSTAAPEFLLLTEASETAAKELEGANYRTATDRRQLLDLRYSAAWGDAVKIKPDAFIVGKVISSDDLRKVTVTLEAFDRESMYEIVEFEVQTDRFVLPDLGQGFSLTRGGRKGTSDVAIFTAVEEDTAYSEKIGSEKINNEKIKTNIAPSAGKFPVALTVYYDNKPQEMTVEHGSYGSNNKVLPEPRTGMNLTFGLKNMTDKPLAVVLLVNGVNTLYEQEGNPKDLNKWVLEPGREYRVKGFHQQGNEKYSQITTLTEKESKEQYSDLGGQQFAGLVHLHVFKTVDPALAEIPQFTRSIGRISRAARANGRHHTITDLKQAIAKKSDLFPRGTKPLAGWGKEFNETLEEQKLGEIQLTDVLVVRYSKLMPE